MKDYDDYYASGYYDSRYPNPNPNTLNKVKDLIKSIQIKKGVEHLKVLDFGCGSGRYAIPLLMEFPGLYLVGVDPSESARNLIEVRAQRLGLKNRLSIVPSVNDCEKGFDCVFMIFGVLSHITSTSQRYILLSSLRECLKNDGEFFCTVPNLFRRFPRNVLSNIYKQRSIKRISNIDYKRRYGMNVLSLQYHLYTPASLKHELCENGFDDIVLSPESIMPEKFITKGKVVSRVDGAASELLPESLGYCIVANAVKKSYEDTI